MLHAIGVGIAYLLLGVGILLGSVAYLAMPKKDERFKTGYKDNETPTWHWPAGIVGIVLGSAGFLLMRALNT